jgi:hypothetical protein
VNNKIGENKIFGLYPGLLKIPENINICSQLELFFIIDGLSFSLDSAMHTHNCYDIVGSSTLSDYIDELQYALEFCIYQTKKFGVDIPDPKAGEHIELTSSYMAWLNCWDNYAKHELSDSKFGEYIRKKRDGEDISMFKSTGSWQDNNAFVKKLS